MMADFANTPAGLLAAEMSLGFKISATTVNATGEKLIRFRLEQPEMYFTPDDAREIAASIIRLADYSDGKIDSPAPPG